MTSATLLPSPAQSVRPTFTAAGIHDGMLAGFRAQEALGLLRHELTPDFDVRTMAWSFQQLERLDVRSMARRSAGDAQMIFIAGAGSIPLPPHIESWLDACMSEHRVRHDVLVALPDIQISRLVDEDLFLRSVRQFSARWQIQMMTGSDFDADVCPEFVRQRFFASAPAPPPQPAHPRFSVQFEPLPRFYGINE